MKRLVIGDIHGCYEELQALLDKAGLDADDEIIAVGDLVDRGPETPNVLQWFRETPNARSIQGNHERKHVRSTRGEIEPALSQLITRWQLGEQYEDACRYMAELPLWIELPEALVVHGFYEPGVPLAEQRETVLAGTMSGEKYMQRHYARPWYELYDGEKPLIVGHLVYPEPLVYKDRVYCIDTGCCHGGALTGLILPEFRLISVPGRKDWWSEMKQRYLEAEEDSRT